MTFGSLAVSERPWALRPRLATGLPLSSHAPIEEVATLRNVFGDELRFSRIEPELPRRPINPTPRSARVQFRVGAVWISRHPVMP